MCLLAYSKTIDIFQEAEARRRFELKEIAEKELKLQQEIWEQQRKLQQLQQERKQEEHHQSTAGTAIPSQNSNTSEHPPYEPGTPHKIQTAASTQPRPSTPVKQV